jgi:monoamine oxidase
MTTELDVLIVGGGWTGVSAALALHEHNSANPDKAVAFALLEGDQSRLGGRAYSFVHTWTDKLGVQRSARFEHGAQYVGSEQTSIFQLIQQAIDRGLISKDDFVDGCAARKSYREQVMMIAGKRYAYDRAQALFGIGGIPPEVGLWDVMGVLAVVQMIEAAERCINVLSPWESPEWVTDLDSITLLEWINRLKLSPGAVSLLRVSVEAVISVQPEQVSAFYFMWYCACNDGFLNEVNDEQGGPQQYYLACGLDTLVERLAAPLAEQIQRGQIVQTIDYGSDQAVTVTTADQKTYRAKKLIVATSPASARSIQFQPPLPAAWQTITTQQMGSTVKCVVFYRSPWWRNIQEQKDATKQGVPQYTGYCGANDYPVIWVMDYSPVGPDYSDQDCFALMTFTIGQEATTLLKDPTRDKIIAWVTTALSNLFNDSRALSSSNEFLDLKWFAWNEATPLIPGGPNTVFAKGILTGDDAPARAFDAPVDGKVYFAAAELACKTPSERTTMPTFVPDWQSLGATGTYSDFRESLGYMDGAVNCGRFVAKQVLEDLSLCDRWQPPASARAEASTSRENAALLPSLATLARKREPLSAATVCAALTQLCRLIQADAAVPPDGWPPGAWNSGDDGTAVQRWFAKVLVELLVSHGLLEQPPAQPPDNFDRSQALEYMSQMAVWEPLAIRALLYFASSGYARQVEAETGTSTVNEIERLAMLASDLLKLKSNQPGPAGTGTSSGRVTSLTQLLRSSPNSPG